MGRFRVNEVEPYPINYGWGHGVLWYTYIELTREATSDEDLSTLAPGHCLLMRMEYLAVDTNQFKKGDLVDVELDGLKVYRG